MASHTTSGTRWEQRIARARDLARDYVSASEALTFYATIAEYQRSLFLAAQTRLTSPFADAIDIDRVASSVAGFLDVVERTGPAPLRSAVHVIREERPNWRRLIRESLTRDDAGPAADLATFVVEAVLQPYAEAAALDRTDAGQRSNESDLPEPHCPICSSLPCVAILREEGHGAKRTLLCGRCATEWHFPRVRCPRCGEEQFDALPIYTADAFPHMRIDACETCRTYLKAIDLTKNGLAVPLVDDIASVALDLWAVEQGYRRLQPNLLRTSEVGRRVTD